MAKTAIIIPIYKSDFSEHEIISLAQCIKVLSNHTIIVVKPEHLQLPAQFTDVVSHSESFDDRFFSGIRGYNELMLSPVFYERFLTYEYILIYQLDCFVFKDELDKWCARNWDYIGAPWIKKTYHKNRFQLWFSNFKERLEIKYENPDGSKHLQRQQRNRVGNGGFSLRRTKKFYNIAQRMKTTIDHYLTQDSHLFNEDVFWSIEVNRSGEVLSIPDYTEALKFAFEVPAVKAADFTGDNVPFGCHDWDHYIKYWQPIFKNLGYQI
ncbi:DUF5672 family protein [Pedobacter sp. AW1-32]|uniref:DUF5672 family protein n=1 Tax=Pedobacter sp. AW1-32 TaxID=3383026 RepID=UPI003FF04535